MFSVKRGKAKEVPQWKLDMLRAEAEAAETSSAASAPAAVDTAAGTAAGAQDGPSDQSSKRAREFDDDDGDDDDDKDLSAYQLGDDDDDAGNSITVVQDQQLTREQQLLMRESRLGGPRKSTKTFMVEDAINSEEQSAGRERTIERAKTKVAAAGMLPGGFTGR